MSREQRIISKLEGTYDFIEFVNNNYRHILDEWNNSRGLSKSPTADADVNNPGEGNAYEE
jgi:hypothetical protein